MHKYLHFSFKFLIILALYFIPVVTFKNNPMFYEALIKPSWAPPTWFISLIWTSIYAVMAFYFTVIINKYGFTKETKHIYLWIVINFIINACFNPIFYGNKNIYFGIVISLLTLVTICYIYLESYKVDKKLSILLLPYVLWSLFISLLIINIYLAS